MGGKGGRCIYIKIAKKKSPSCCRVPASCSKKCLVELSQPILGDLIPAVPSVEQHPSVGWKQGWGRMLGLEEGGYTGTSQGMFTSARHQSRDDKAVMEAVTPAVGEERSRSSSTGSWKSGNRKG